MAIGSLVERAARIVWQHKILAALSILDVFLTSGALAGRALSDVLLQAALGLPQISPYISPASLPPPLLTIGQLGQFYRWIAPAGAAGWIALIVAGLILLVAFALLALVIEGGIIAAVPRLEEDARLTAGSILARGWRRALPMLVIASVPAIPLTLGAILVVIIATAVLREQGGLETVLTAPDLAREVSGQLGLIAVAILCPLAILTLPLSLLAVLAYRACMLEARDAVASLRRAREVLRGHIGPVLILIVIGYGVSALAGFLAVLPAQLALIFLPALLVVWLIEGVARAYYLILWTLGWRAWTSGNENPPLAEKGIDPDADVGAPRRN